MKVLLISDAHANIEALEAILNHANADDVVFMGDVVDYGPNPVEVFDLLNSVNAKRALGNHDAAAAFGIDCRSGPATHEAAVVTRQMITLKLMPERSLNLLGKAARRIELEYGDLKIRAMHAGPKDELYEDVTREQAEKLDMQGADLLLLGHTHAAYEVKEGGLWAVNPGSVGLPSDGDPRASYAVLDTGTKQITFGRAKYDIEEVVSKLRNTLGHATSTFQKLATWLRTARE
jgi:protein phosphatase